MAHVVIFPASLGPECRAFTNVKRAEQWILQAGIVGAVVTASDCVRFYRCRAYTGKLQLFPASELLHCGHFINDRHFKACLRQWSGWAASEEKVRYEYDEYQPDPGSCHEITDQRHFMSHLANPALTV